MKKLLLTLFFIFTVISSIELGYGQEYTFFYGDRCSHCAKVEDYRNQNDTHSKHDIQMVETWTDTKGAQKFADKVTYFGIDHKDVGVPFLVLSGGTCYLMGDEPIISYFEQIEIKQDLGTQPICPVGLNSQDTNPKSLRGIIGGTILLAGADSINPCEFAIIVIVLVSILTKTGNRKKTLLAGLLFSLGLGIVYFILGLGIAQITSSMGGVIIKYVIGAIAIVIGLINIKDVFWYGKFVVAEVPFSRRPKMKKILSNVASPAGAFMTGILVSAFITPCSGGPLFAFSGMIGSNSDISSSLYHWFLLLYTIIFVSPIWIITFLISFGYADSSIINKFKEDNSNIIHLIIGIAMLALGAYIFWII